MKYFQPWAGGGYCVGGRAVGDSFPWRRRSQFSAGADLVVWRTMVFTTLTFAQMGNALSIRSSDDLLVTIGVFSNRLMIGAVLLTVVLQLLLLYTPFFQAIFKVAPLSWTQLLLCFVLSWVLFSAVEGVKWLRQRKVVRGSA